MTTPSVRGRIEGTAKVVRFNWASYAAAAGLVVLAVVAVVRGSTPWPIGGLVVVAASAGAVWALASVAATWWVYDHRRVYDRIASDDDTDRAVTGAWVAVHAGFDDATPRVAVRHDRPPVVLALRAGSASIDRAARLFPAPGLPASARSLPLASGRACRVYLSFAAHEVRDPRDLADLFAEAARALRPGGRLVVTEHVLDTANVAVYGPGALHFRTRRTWLRHGAGAGLALADERRLTPFVRRFTWQRPDA